MGRLDGRVALVTGAGGGIGREHALLLVREGAAVVVDDINTRTVVAAGGGEELVPGLRNRWALADHPDLQEFPDA